MQKYTLTVLINEKVSDADRNSTFEAIKKHFSTLIKEDMWGVRSLAYEIKHASKAFYAFFEFEAEPTSVITLDKNIRLNEDIVRYLIIKKKEIREKIKVTKKPETPKEELNKDVEVEKIEAVIEIKEEPKAKRAVKIKSKKE